MLTVRGGFRQKCGGLPWGELVPGRRPGPEQSSRVTSTRSHKPPGPVAIGYARQYCVGRRDAVRHQVPVESAIDRQYASVTPRLLTETYAATTLAPHLAQGYVR